MPGGSEKPEDIGDREEIKGAKKCNFFLGLLTALWLYT